MMKRGKKRTVRAGAHRHCHLAPNRIPSRDREEAVPPATKEEPGFAFSYNYISKVNSSLLANRFGLVEDGDAMPIVGKFVFVGAVSLIGAICPGGLRKI